LAHASQRNAAAPAKTKATRAHLGEELSMYYNDEVRAAAAPAIRPRTKTTVSAQTPNEGLPCLLTHAPAAFVCRCLESPAAALPLPLRLTRRGAACVRACLARS
jgi:hypothetical protein